MNRATIAVIAVASVFFALAGIAYVSKSASNAAAPAFAQEKPKPMTPQQIQAMQASNRQAAAQAIAAKADKENKSKQSNARFKACRAKLKKAHSLDLLYDLNLEGGYPRVIAGPTFFQIPIDAKQGFAETVNCFLTAGDNKFVNFEILDWRTGKAIGRYHWGRFEML